MTIHFCAWDQEDGPYSLLVDAKDESEARRIASDAAGEPPKRCLPWTGGGFVAEIVTRELGDGDEEMVLEPFPHVEDALTLLEDAADGATRTVVLDAPQCGAEATDEASGTWQCVLTEGHEGEHRAADGERWGDE